MAAYERVTLNRGGRNSRFDCNWEYSTVQYSSNLHPKDVSNERWLKPVFNFWHTVLAHW